MLRTSITGYTCASVQLRGNRKCNVNTKKNVVGPKFADSARAWQNIQRRELQPPAALRVSDLVRRPGDIDDSISLTRVGYFDKKCRIAASKKLLCGRCNSVRLPDNTPPL